MLKLLKMLQGGLGGAQRKKGNPEVDTHLLRTLAKSNSPAVMTTKAMTTNSSRFESRLKQRASTSPSVPVPTSGSSSGTSAPLQMGSFWSRQNCRVHERQGLEGSCRSSGRQRGMIVLLSKQMPAVS